MNFSLKSTVKKTDVLVIGAGISGLTAAAYLAKNNRNVLLYEKNSNVGGLVGAFKRNGFHFDYGARAFENSGILFPMLKTLDIPFSYIKNNVKIGIGSDFVDVSYDDSLIHYKKLLKKYFPNDKEAIDLIVDDIDQVVKLIEVVYEIDNPLFYEKPYKIEYLRNTLFPWLKRFKKAQKDSKPYLIPVRKYLLKYTQNKALIDMITQAFFDESSAYFTLSYFGLYKDYIYPYNGTQTLTLRLNDAIKKFGGHIYTNKEAIEIDPIKKIVTFSDHSKVSYNQLIWASDQSLLYKMIKNNNHKKIFKQKELINNSKTNESILTISLGVDIKPEIFNELFGQHGFYTPSTLGLSSLESWKKATNLDDWVKKYLELTTYEISIPTLRDKTLSPENQTGLIISTLFDYELTNHYFSENKLDHLKTLVFDFILKIFNDHLNLDLKANLIIKDISTPLSIKRINSSFKGSVTGWALSNKIMPVYTELKDVKKSVLTPIKDVYQCGQWAFAPAGVPTAILTGKLAADRVLKKKRKL